MALDPGDGGSGTYTPEGTYDLVIPERVWVVDKEAWTETVPAGVLPMVWARLIQAALIAKDAAPIVSKVI